jgi:hypothetical protein
MDFLADRMLTMMTDQASNFYDPEMVTKRDPTTPKPTTREESSLVGRKRLSDWEEWKKMTSPGWSFFHWDSSLGLSRKPQVLDLNAVR